MPWFWMSHVCLLFHLSGRYFCFLVMRVVLIAVHSFVEISLSDHAPTDCITPGVGFPSKYDHM